MLLLVVFVCLGFIEVISGVGGRTLVGGVQEINLTSLSPYDKSLIENATAKGISLMNAVKTENGSNNERPIQLIQILRAAKQLVAGLNIYLDLSVDIDGNSTTCKLRVSDLYLWNNGGIWSVTTVSDSDPCKPYIPPIPRQRRSAPMLGEENEIDANDVMGQQAVAWSVKHINKMSNSLFMQALQKVTRVTKQVVNGLRYHLFVTIVSTSCRNQAENHHKTIQECPAANDPKPQDCDISVIYSQREYRMDNFKCKPRKGAIGGDTHDYVPHGTRPANVKHMTILGGDTHDYLPHTDDKCADYLQAFKEFKSKYNRLYGSSEEEARKLKIFCDNMEKVKIIQSVEQGSAQYGVNEFADLSEEEFRQNYLGFKPSVSSNQRWPQADIPEGPIPDSWDWRDHNAVTPVKNQGGCGSCWAFSTTGNIEGQWAVNSQSHNLLSLSEQELVDCDKIDKGCNGGYMSDAYEAIMELGGIETESDYKYTGQDQQCHFNKSEVVVKLTGAVNISKDEGEMAAWLYKNGPIAIGINAFPMQFYLWGIAHPWKFFCDPNALDHGVLIVGYGKKGNEPYWIIKNSWGPRWGRQGYYYIYRGDGSCGLNTMCSSATVA